MLKSLKKALFEKNYLQKIFFLNSKMLTKKIKSTRSSERVLVSIYYYSYNLKVYITLVYTIEGEMILGEIIVGRNNCGAE
jgi:hypothetical protein